MLGKFFLFSLLAFLFGCAHPHYADSDSALDEMQSRTCAFSFSSEEGNSITCAQIQWEKMQTEDETGSFILSFGNISKDKNLNLQDPPSLPAAKLWMPGMAHGSSPLTVSKVSAGVYRVTGVWFSMPGLWEIQVKFLGEQGASFESHLPVRY